MKVYTAVVFDLLTGLLDSWALWSDVAGSAEAGLRWRRRYLDLTYGAGPYRPYASIVKEAAVGVGLDGDLASRLIDRWSEMEPWPEAPSVLMGVASRFPIAILTNCSTELAHIAVDRLGVPGPAVVTAEEIGWYKPAPQMYLAAAHRLGQETGGLLFVAGSPGDVDGAIRVGFDVYWHNRIGLPGTSVEPTYQFESLTPLLRLI